MKRCFALMRSDAIERVKTFFDLKLRSATDLLSTFPRESAYPELWDPFEAAVRAVLGQQISVKAATTFAARLCDQIRPNFPMPCDVADRSVDGHRSD